jgi:hypothetical protein
MAAPDDKDSNNHGGGGPDDNSAAARAAAEDAPPFYTWNKIYGFVAVALVIQVVIYAVLTHVMK